MSVTLNLKRLVINGPFLNSVMPKIMTVRQLDFNYVREAKEKMVEENLKGLRSNLLPFVTYRKTPDRKIWGFC